MTRIPGPVRAALAVLLLAAALGSVFLDNQTRLGLLALLAVVMFAVWSRSRSS